MFYSKLNLIGVLHEDVRASLALLEMSLLLHFSGSIAFSMPTPHWGKLLEIFLCCCWFLAEFLLLALSLLLWLRSSRTLSSCSGVFWTSHTPVIPPNLWLRCILMIRHLCFPNGSIMKIIIIGLNAYFSGALNNSLPTQLSFSSSDTAYPLQFLYKSQTSPGRRHSFIHIFSSGTLLKSRQSDFSSLSI